ncbi:RNA polymerase sigma factor [Lignipirellula cremea]|uniref:RNA polymerase sigma factor n=1 Tax=Lignipirellula cremea TaxID=2528010 RepID=UPI001E5388D3|nr:sigma-70 family RNA polymerase sigma factor [Lignipirellula cremea]
MPRFESLDPDVRLMLKVRDDDAAAFEELVLRHQNRLLTVFEHWAPCRGSAEDLAQEVFLRIYRARKQYTPDARFTTWLYTIANNVAHNARRKQARRHESQLPGNPNESGGVSMENLAQAASGQMPTRQLDRAEMSQVVRQAIEALSERQRMALILSKFEHMSYADIAITMDLSESAVKSLLTRARVNLRGLLEPYMAEGE